MSCPFLPRTGALFAVSLLLLSFSPARADEFDKRIDPLVKEAMEAWHVPGVAVVVVSHNEVVYLKGFGKRGLSSGELVTPDTVFPLASCTKGFTSMAMAMLVSRGKMNWDDPVRKHLPAFRLADPLANENVVMRDLLCHRTGVGGHDFLSYHSPWGVDEQIRRLGFLKPNYSFRSTYQYQGIMYAAVGQAVASASGKSWDEFVREELVKPLGMKSVSFTTTEALKSKDYAYPHRWVPNGPNKFKVAELPEWYPMKEPNGAVSMNASARDLGQWLRFQLGDGSWDTQKLLDARHLEETRTPQVVIRLEGIARKEQPFTTFMSYGMGWVVQDYRGHKLVAHGGRVDGMRTHISLAPDDGLAVAVLSNLENTRMNLALSNNIIDALLDLKPHDWNDHLQKCVQAAGEAENAERRKMLAKQHKDTKPSRELSAYAGAYEDPAYGTANVTVAEGRLVWHWSTFHAPLEHFHYDTFSVTEDLLRRPQLVFALGADGEVAGFRVMDVEFKKVRNK